MGVDSVGCHDVCISHSQRVSHSISKPIRPRLTKQKRTTWARTWRASGPCCCCGGCGAAPPSRWGPSPWSGPRGGTGYGPVFLRFSAGESLCVWVGVIVRPIHHPPIHRQECARGHLTHVRTWQVTSMWEPVGLKVALLMELVCAMPQSSFLGLRASHSRTCFIFVLVFVVVRLGGSSVVKPARHVYTRVCCIQFTRAMSVNQSTTVGE